jgi:hypothetical protein
VVSVGRENGHNNELFLPCTVKSCSRTVDSEVRRAENLTLLLVPEILLPLTVDPLDFPVTTDRRCAAFLPSRIATAVCCLELVCVLCGSGTKPALSDIEICRSGGSCNLAIVAEISESPEAYLSANCWYWTDIR